MNNIEKIYFDMDGVLVDFWGGLFEMCGDVNSSDMHEVWKAVKSVEHFYAKLKPVDGAIEMLRSFKEIYKDKCEILSAIPAKEKGILYAAEDKINWVKEYIGDDIKVNIVQRHEKKNFCKGKQYILIDDFPKNVIEWKENGGTAILFKSVEQVKEDFHIK